MIFISDYSFSFVVWYTHIKSNKVYHFVANFYLDFLNKGKNFGSLICKIILDSESARQPFYNSYFIRKMGKKAQKIETNKTIFVIPDLGRTIVRGSLRPTPIVYFRLTKVLPRSVSYRTRKLHDRLKTTKSA